MHGKKRFCFVDVYINLFTSMIKGGVRAAKRIISPYNNARRASALNTHGVFIKQFPRGVTHEDLHTDTQLLFHVRRISN